GAGAEAIEAALVDVMGEDERAFGGELQRLSARAGAEIEDGFARLRLDEEADELAAFVLRLEETFLPGSGAEEIGLAGLDDQRVAHALRRSRRDAVVFGKAAGEAVARGEEAG